MIVNKCYETIIVLYLSTILTEKGLDKNIQIKHELTGNRVFECLTLKKKNDVGTHRSCEPNVNFLPTSVLCHLITSFLEHFTEPRSINFRMSIGVIPVVARCLMT